MPIYRHLKKEKSKKNICSLNSSSKYGWKKWRMKEGDSFPLVADKATWVWTPTLMGFEKRYGPKYLIWTPFYIPKSQVKQKYKQTTISRLQILEVSSLPLDNNNPGIFTDQTVDLTTCMVSLDPYNVLFFFLLLHRHRSR